MILSLEGITTFFEKRERDIYLQKIKLTHFLINVLFHFHNIAHLDSTIILLISVSGKKEGFKRVYPHFNTCDHNSKENCIFKNKLSFDIYIQHSHLIVVNYYKKLNIIEFVNIEWLWEEIKTSFKMTVWIRDFIQLLGFVFFWRGKLQEQS